MESGGCLFAWMSKKLKHVAFLEFFDFLFAFSFWLIECQVLPVSCVLPLKNKLPTVALLGCKSTVL